MILRLKKKSESKMLHYTTRKHAMYIFFTYNLEHSMDICIAYGKINIHSLLIEINLII